MEPKTILTIASYAAKGIEILLKKNDNDYLDMQRHAEIMSALADINLSIANLKKEIENIYLRLSYIPDLTADTINLKELQGFIGQYQRLLRDFHENGLRPPLEQKIFSLLDKIGNRAEYIETNNSMNPVLVFVMSSAMKAEISLTKIYDPESVKYLKEMYLEYFNRILEKGINDPKSFPPIETLLAAERDRVESFLIQGKVYKRTIDTVNWEELKNTIKNNHPDAESVPYVENTIAVELSYNENEEVEKLLSLGIISEGEKYDEFKFSASEKYCDWYHKRADYLQKLSNAGRTGISDMPLKKYDVTHKQNVKRWTDQIRAEYESAIPLDNLYILASAAYTARLSIEFLNQQ